MIIEENVESYDYISMWTIAKHDELYYYYKQN